MDEASAYLAINSRRSVRFLLRETRPRVGRKTGFPLSGGTALNGGRQFHIRRIRAVAVRASATMLMTLA